MKTLSKEITLGRFFNEDPENYRKLREQWSKMVNSEKRVTLTLADHVIYLALIGKNWQKAITLPTNKNKVENHYKPKIKSFAERWEYNIGWQRNRVIEKFSGAITEEMYDALRALTDFDISKEPYKDIGA